MASEPQVLRFDLPFGASVANLTGPVTGIARLVGRPPAERTATLIDTADHRLLDWSVELSRIAQTGRWLLRAPGWQPTLPVEQESPAAEDEIPADMAAVLVPFRRGGILGPKLKVLTTRRRFTLSDAAGAPCGDLTDEQVRVGAHAGELVRYRNVTLRCGGLDADQVSAITAAFTAAGATAVDDFAPVAARLDLARHTQRRGALSARVPIDDFVRTQFEARWRRLLRADLALRTGGGDDADLRAELRAFRGELAGLHPLLESSWVTAAEHLADAALADGRPLQHTDRWLRVLDALARASVEPPLAGVAGRTTGPVLAQELEAVVQTLSDQCRTLESFSEDARWARAHDLGRRALALSTLARDVFGKPAKQLRRELVAVVEALAETVRPDATGLARDLHDLTVTEVFEAGRAYERAMLSVDYARQRFREQWPGLWERLRGRMIRPRVPHGEAS